MNYIRLSIGNCTLLSVYKIQDTWGQWYNKSYLHDLKNSDIFVELQARQIEKAREAAKK